MAGMIDNIRTQTNAVWEQWGWTVIGANLIFGVIFLFMLLGKSNENAGR